MSRSLRRAGARRQALVTHSLQSSAPRRAARRPAAAFTCSGRKCRCSAPPLRCQGRFRPLLPRIGRAGGACARCRERAERRRLEMAEVEETLKRIQSQKGVQGIIVVNSEGIPIKSTMDNSTTIQYAGLMHSFIMKARSTVRDIDPQNDLTFLRIRSKKNEIMVAPDKDYFLIVIQNPTE
ncbi:dynein light chain roadblock-type 1 isoform X1 [Columba livia]|uniref:dynein light chain roadblock-type 1 isoform X1 n=1 Tax=Columba livia TaxID=8932 RepID=UPI0031BB34A0